MRLAPALRVAAVLGLLANLPAGCTNEDEAPVQAARAFTAAAQRGDAKAMLELVERDVAAHLDAAAEQASDQVGGRRSIEPAEMLQFVPGDPNFAIASAEVVDNDGTVAHVRLTGPEDQEHVLELVMQEGSWRVRLPIPVGSVRESS